MTSRGGDDAWEAACLRFETPEEETEKFFLRLSRLGAPGWPAGGRTVEFFCGRGSGLAALESVGFHRPWGADLSLSLLSKSWARGSLIAADCRMLPFGERSCDIAIVQGGLHHLPSLPGDLDRTLAEARRVLKEGGRFVAVEPWLTPFLRLVHFLCRRPLVRRLSVRMDALETMIEHERDTYEPWLASPQMILRLLRERFEPEICFTRLGKLYFVGRKREG